MSIKSRCTMCNELVNSTNGYGFCSDCYDWYESLDPWEQTNLRRNGYRRKKEAERRYVN